MSAPILHLTVSQRPVFLLNSRLGLFTAALSGLHPNRAPLLPKLRGHFAEFLNESSPDHLRILSSPTCVGLRYGHPPSSLEAFLGSVKSGASILMFSPHHCLHLPDGFAYPTRSQLGRTLPSVRSPYPPASPRSLERRRVVQESPPVVHRLRLSASA